VVCPPAQQALAGNATGGAARNVGLAKMLIKHLGGILNYCPTKVRSGVVEAINGNIRMLINRGRGYKNMRYLLLKAKRMAVTNTEYQ
jgi:hypothetical protein